MPASVGAGIYEANAAGVQMHLPGGPYSIRFGRRFRLPGGFGGNFFLTSPRHGTRDTICSPWFVAYGSYHLTYCSGRRPASSHKGGHIAQTYCLRQARISLDNWLTPSNP